MHFPKIRDLFHRRKASIAEAPEAAYPEGGNVVQHGGVSAQGGEDVFETQNAERRPPCLPSEQDQPIGSDNLEYNTPGCSLYRPSYSTIFWPNHNRAPSTMHFYVPSRRSSSSYSTSSSTTTTPQDTFQDFSKTFTHTNDPSSPGLRPGAISRFDNNSNHGSITIQYHPAILDNPPPFSRWSSPPKLINPDWHPSHHHAREPNTTTLRRHASILAIESDLLTTRLEQTRQDLDNTTRTRDVTRQMLKDCNEMRLQAEDECGVWKGKYRQMYSGLESVLRANNAVEQELRYLAKDHAVCKAREAGLQDRIGVLLTSRWRGNSYLKRRLIETNDRNNILVNSHDQQTEALTNLRSRNNALQRSVEVSEQKMATMEAQLIMANKARGEDTEALQLAEREVYQLSERLRGVEMALHAKAANLEDVVQEKERLETLLRLAGE